MPMTLMKSEVSIMLCCQLCSTRYTALQIKNAVGTVHSYTNVVLTHGFMEKYNTQKPPFKNPTSTTAFLPSPWW